MLEESSPRLLLNLRFSRRVPDVFNLFMDLDTVTNEVFKDLDAYRIGLEFSFLDGLVF